jgi:hypothetical protein
VLEHAKNRSTESAKRAGRTQVGIAVTALARSGQRWLCNVGQWSGNGFELERNEPWYQRVQSLATGRAFETWSADVKLEDLAEGRPELTYTKEEQFHRAMSRVYDIVMRAPAREHGYNLPQDWASDGSTVATRDTHSVTAAAIGTKSIQVQLVNPNASSLQAEVAGLVLAATASYLDRVDKAPGSERESRNPVIHTDHLNSITRLAKDSPKKGPTSKGEHWYGWYKHIARFDDTPPILKHVKAHTSTATVAECMNDECNQLAKQAHRHEVPIMPEPVFCLPKYALLEGSLGYVENDPRFTVMDPSAESRFQHLNETEKQRLCPVSVGWIKRQPAGTRRRSPSTRTARKPRC